MSIVISVIVPTYNRAAYLGKAIDSLNDQSLSKNLYEIIVVDNASTDETKNIVEKKNKEIHNLSYIYEAKLGLNIARNTGVKNATGKYIAFIDDDAIANHYWLEKIVWVFENVNPVPGAVGGKVDPIWETKKPDWLSAKLERYITIIDWTKEATFLEHNQFLAGANMAFERYTLVELGGFQEGLDRVGNKLISNGDILIIDRLKERGYKLYYHPEIYVQHLVPAGRLSQKWFISRFYWQGYSDALMWKFKNKPSFSNKNKSLINKSFQLFFNLNNLRLLSTTPKDAQLFQSKLRAHQKLGYLVGILS